MSDQFSALQTRVESLEKQNRNLRRLGGGLVATLGVVALLGMAAPKVCKTVWGERFVLRDDHGRDRMLLDAYNTDSPSLTMMDERGKSLARLNLAPEGMQVRFFRNGKPGSAIPIGPDVLGTSKRKAERTPHEKDGVGTD